MVVVVEGKPRLGKETIYHSCGYNRTEGVALLVVVVDVLTDHL